MYETFMYVNNIYACVNDVRDEKNYTYIKKMQLFYESPQIKSDYVNVSM